MRQSLAMFKTVAMLGGLHETMFKEVTANDAAPRSADESK